MNEIGFMKKAQSGDFGDLLEWIQKGKMFELIKLCGALWFDSFLLHGLITRRPPVSLSSAFHSRYKSKQTFSESQSAVRSRTTTKQWTTRGPVKPQVCFPSVIYSRVSWSFCEAFSEPGTGVALLVLSDPRSVHPNQNTSRTPTVKTQVQAK